MLITLIFEHVTTVPEQSYKSRIGEAKKVIEDVKDVPYIACYLALKCDAIWTSDSDFEGKKGIKTITTAELLKLL